MANAMEIICFSLDSQRFGLRLAAVDRVVHAVQVTPLPQAPHTVLGVINLQGQIIPVMNLRQRFDLPGRDIELTDQFIVAHRRSNRGALGG